MNGTNQPAATVDLPLQKRSMAARLHWFVRLLAMKTDTTVDHFDQMTDFVSREARKHVLDSLACVFHNEGYSMEGNTEHNDTLWLANRICEELHGKNIERVSPEVEVQMMKVAAIAKHSLQGLADRMASRYVRVSKAIRTMERIAQQQGK